MTVWEIEFEAVGMDPEFQLDLPAISSHGALGSESPVAYSNGDTLRMKRLEKAAEIILTEHLTNITINWAPPKVEDRRRLYIVQDGASDITWPGNITWMGEGPPTDKTATSETTVVLTTTDGGSRIRGYISGEGKLPNGQ